MKRYLIFYGEVFHPRGGMRDFLVDFDDLDSAIEAAQKRAAETSNKDEDLFEYNWAHVFDSVTGKIVWAEESAAMPYYPEDEDSGLWP